MQALWVLVATFCSALAFACVKLSGTSYAFYEVCLVRAVYLLAVTATLAIYRRTIFKTQNPLLHLVRCAAGVSATSLNLVAIQHIALGTAQTLFNTAPLFACAWVLVRTRLSLRHDYCLAGSVLFGFIGVYLVLQPSFTGDSLIYALCGLAAGITYGTAQICLRRLGAAREPVCRTAFYYACAMLLYAAFLTGFLSSKSLIEIFFNPVMLCVGLFSVLAQLAQTQGWGKGKTLLCANLQFSAILFSVMLGWLLFDETFSVEMYLSIAVIILSESIAIRIQFRQYSDFCKKDSVCLHR